ncbi:zonular occludens toxin domain-containing protein [Pseudomonas sp. 2FE]|uniref:zonular occludens toxin domain-containing protein n=1 Tax=Pseudomonas sp. 2FE TaxID=2502190 RepID=UPI0010F4456C|nr:zonular occludens toxin domain-containing protein [Pseudomonas sp. 2FE]
MIFGNEGLPRSGKSADSMNHIVDSMRHGRTVVTNIHGINHKAISEYLAIPLPTIQRLLVCLEAPKDLDEDQVVEWTKAQFLKNAVNDCLWIWDEINQFWPVDRQPLAAEWAKFVTEHGHLGIDILIMGQDLQELHTTWRRRLQRYTRFTKLDMMGKENEYHWASYNNCGRNKFKKTAEGKKPYNADFFGFYKSHDDATSNKGNYKDKRFSIFQGKHKFYAALYGGALLVAVWYLVDFWNGGALGAEKKPAGAGHTQSQPAASAPAAEPVAKPVYQSANASQEGAEEAKAEPPIDYLDEFATKYQLRLGGIIDRDKPEPGKPAFEFFLDFLDPAYRIKERMRRVDVASLGWAIERKPFGLVLTKEGKSYVARAWPLDNFGKVPKETIAAMKPAP